ncbi:MAG: alpha/beta hydrolase, partial [Anaerolineales bacterium]|nr:alpha/beta hydrolase [Anaerolineales bacterium]
TSSQRIQGVKLDAAQIKGLPLYPVENITVPTLVVHSTTDPQVPFDGANWIATTIPDATLLKVEGGGHLCFVVYKEQVVPQIVDFLEGIAPDELK